MPGCVCALLSVCSVLLPAVIGRPRELPGLPASCSAHSLTGMMTAALHYAAGEEAAQLACMACWRLWGAALLFCRSS